MATEHLSFDFTVKETLNSNKMPNSFIVKGNMARAIRSRAAKEGLSVHPNQQLANARYEQLQDAAELSLLKSRATKKLNKAKAPEHEIEEAIQKVIANFTPRSDTTDPIAVPTIFNYFKITITVLAPTRIRVDPPNFYPTVKAIIDGLSDASWWEDDNFKHLLEVSFKYGGLSGKKSIYTIKLDFEEVDPEDYVTDAELQED